MNMKNTPKQQTLTLDLSAPRKALYFTCAAVAFVAVSQQTKAQSIDYATFEELFGESITVGATGTPKKASEVPVNMTIISAEEIKRSGARDIPEILRAHSGMDVSRVSQTGATVAIRGYNVDGGRMRVLINGRDTFRTYEGVTQWASLPVNIEEIRQIEIVRGPATSLYGANAVTGVVNIITFNPMTEAVNNVTGRFGNTGLREVSGVATLQFGEGAGGIRLSADYFEGDIFDAPLSPDVALLRAKPENKRLSLDGLFQVADNVQLGIEGTYFDGPVVSQSSVGVGSYSDAEDYSLKATLSAELSSGRWSLSAHRNSNKELRLEVVQLETGPFALGQDIDAKSSYVEVSNFRTIGSKSAIRFSAGWKDDEVVQFGLGELAGTGTVGLRTLFASALWDYTLSDSTTLTTAVRYDHMKARRDADEASWLSFTNDDYGSFAELSVNVGLVYKASEADTVKFMYARGFNAPNLFDLGGQIIDAQSTFPGVRGFGGSPEARPAIVQQYEIQYTRSLDTLNGQFDLAAFYRTSDDVGASSATGRLSTTSDPFFPFYSGYGVIGDMKTLGFEASVSGASESGVTWALRYSYADSDGDYLQDNTAGPVTGSLYPFVTLGLDDRSAKNIVSANLGYDSDRFWVDSLLQYKSGFSSYSGTIYIPGIIDPYTSVDEVWVANVSAGYRVTEGLSVSARVEGLFDKLRQEVIMPSNAAERRIWISLSYDF